MKLFRKDNQKGMTLIELLGVIVIIGILFVALNAAINASTNAAKMSGIKTDFRSIQMGFEQLLRDDDGELPDDVGRVNEYIDMQFDPTTFTADKLSPFGTKYMISFNATDDTVMIYVDHNDDQTRNSGEPALIIDVDGERNPIFKTEGLGKDLTPVR